MSFLDVVLDAVGVSSVWGKVLLRPASLCMLLSLNVDYHFYPNAQFYCHTPLFSNSKNCRQTATK